MKWHILTGEYPPLSGGVGDYAALLAHALADSGDAVDVWVGGPVQPRTSGSCRVHALPDVFGPQSRASLAEAWHAAPGTVLVQYVPNALGRRGTNIAFCRWLLAERRRGRDIRVMFHEPYFYFTRRRPWRNAVAIAQRVMAALLVRSATQLYYSSENWHDYLRPYGAGDRGTVLPIPATIPGSAQSARIQEFRREFAAAGASVVGHFGTFGEHVGGELLAVLPRLLTENGGVHVALIGRDGERFRRELVRRMPASADRLHATGEIAAADVAAAMRACDLLFQPYPDGVTTRRTSVMAGLRNGVATVSTEGVLTERIWRETGAVVLAGRGQAGAAVAGIRRLLDDAAARQSQGARGRDAYVRHFAMALTIARLRVTAPVPVPA
jgi:glycosyltransferase involved in cell wall biosynthesis